MWFYVARYVDSDPDSPRFGQVIIGPVSQEGVTPQGDRLTQWSRIDAESLEEAETRFARGEGERVVIDPAAQAVAAA